MYATAAFDFDQGDNGWLMSEFAIMRSLFLIGLFPRLISLGRRWSSRSPITVVENEACAEEEVAPDCFVTSPGNFDAPSGEQTEQEPMKPVEQSGDHSGCWFDLVFLRWSLLVDGALTTVAAFATKRWHIYLGEIVS